jgi:hypothetical protein
MTAVLGIKVDQEEKVTLGLLFPYAGDGKF